LFIFLIIYNTTATLPAQNPYLGGVSAAVVIIITVKDNRKKGLIMEKERRRRTRGPLNFDVFVDIHGEQIPVKTWDLSLRGMKCSPGTRYKEGDTCQVIIVLSPEARVRIESKIVRASADEAGIYCLLENHRLWRWFPEESTNGTDVPLIRSPYRGRIKPPALRVCHN